VKPQACTRRWAMIKQEQVLVEASHEPPITRIF